MAFLRSLFGRISGRPRQSVELNPVEQIAVRYLLQFGPRSVAAVRQDVTATRVEVGAEVDEAVAHLLEAGLIERSAPDEDEPAGSDLLYAATPKAAVLRGRIPDDPRTVTEFYL
jgi:predicted transcriptional regulator